MIELPASQVASRRYKPRAPFDPTGQFAIVSGAASGSGKAIAVGSDAHGTHSALTDQNIAGAEEVAAGLRGPAFVSGVDVTDPARSENVVNRTRSECDVIDTAFVLPRVSARESTLEIDGQEWQRVADLSRVALLRSGRGIACVMVEQRGRVIRVVPAGSLTVCQRRAACSATKGGIRGVMRVLTRECARHVRVDALAHRYLATPLASQITALVAWWHATEKLQALGRIGSPDEIVVLAQFLASRVSSCVTGSVREVDGSWIAGSTS